MGIICPRCFGKVKDFYCKKCRVLLDENGLIVEFDSSHIIELLMSALLEEQRRESDEVQIPSELTNEIGQEYMTVNAELPETENVISYDSDFVKQHIEEQNQLLEQYNVRYSRYEKYSEDKEIPQMTYYPFSNINFDAEFNASYTCININIRRATQAELGFGVLGCAFLGTNCVKVLDYLEGNAFEEVLHHEINHIMNPELTERQIRHKTKYELPFEANYH